MKADAITKSEDCTNSAIRADTDPAAFDTAQHHMVTRVPTARGDERVRSVLASLTSQPFDVADTIYVIDEIGRLEGCVPLPDLLLMHPDSCLRDFMIDGRTAVNPGEDQERVVSLAVEQGITSVPVVNADRRLLGVVPARNLMAILRHEHIEDLHRLAGIHHEYANASRALEASPFERARKRLPWLFIGFLGSFFATFIMSRFERLLEARLAVAFFVPGIVYLADAIGTQTEAIAVRGLSLSRASLHDLLGGELRTGLLIGATLAALSFPAVLLAFSDAWLAFAVALAILTAGMTATTTGLLFPWVLSYAGKDPAFGSGPVATIVQDVLSLLMYFMAVQLLL
jgi:magnesium transporter